MKRCLLVIFAVCFLAMNSWSAVVAHYEFEGDLLDSAGTNDGIAVGTAPVGYLPALNGPVNGGFGQYLYLDGVDQYINCGSDLTLAGTAMTLSAWIYDLTPAATDHFDGIVTRDGYQSDWGLRRYSLTLEGYPHLVDKCQFVADNDQGGLVSDQTVGSNVWTHVAVTFDGDVIRYYINGTLDTYTYDTTKTSLPSVSDILIGYDADKADSYFNGYIDDVRIYDTALSEAEITALMVPANAETKATNPVPADGQTGVYVSPTLTWQPGWDVADANGHTVYLGTDFSDVDAATLSDPLTVTVTTLSEPNYLAGQLELGTMYYWRVDERSDSNDITKGDVWSFIIQTSASEDGLVAHYEFEGNLIDSAGINNGTAVGTAPLAYLPAASGPAAGTFGQSVYLDGVDQYINCGNGLTMAGTAITVSAWIYDLIPATTDHFSGIVTRNGYHKDWALRRYSLNLEGYPHLVDRCQFVADDDQGGLVSDQTVGSGAWTHIAATFDGDVIRYYINGVLDDYSYDTAKTSLLSVSDILIGYDTDKEDSYFNGYIDDVRIYDVALSESEIAALMGSAGPQAKATAPTPADGLSWVDVSPVLSWQPGFDVSDANGHTVYLGTDFSDVDNADFTSPLTATVTVVTESNYPTGQLVPDTVYYWRVDENNASGETIKGDVWSFTTKIMCPEGDFYADCMVNFDDLIQLAQVWLTGSVNEDVNNDGTVNLEEFSLVAENYLAGTDLSQTVRNLMLGIPQHIVTYGTSLTDDVSDAGAWVEMLRQDLSAKFPGLVTVTNNGKGGEDSTWAVPNLQEKVIDENPDTVFIEFAINDAINWRNISVATSKSNLEYMIDQILLANPDCEIIVMTMTHPGAPGLSNFNRLYLSDYYQAYRDVAQERGLLLIDHDSTWLQIVADDVNQYLFYVPDETHPTYTGCQEVVYPGVMEGLGL